MKRRKTNLILCSLAFITAVLAEVYCFLEFRGDALTVLGTGAIVLVTAFLTLDSILSTAGFGEKEDKGNSESWDRLEKRLEELEKLQKAGEIMLKKNVMKQQEMIGKLSAQMIQQKEIIVKTGKLVAKHHREDAEKMIILLQKISEKPGFDETNILETMDSNFQSANLLLDKLVTEMTELKEKMNSMPVLSANIDMATAIPEEIETQAVPKTIEETISEVEEESEREVAVSSEPLSEPIIEESISEPEPEPVAETPAIDTSDPNKMMSPDDIASLLASMGGDEASAEEEPVAVSEPEPEPVAEAPAIDTSDPNKMMSPDDIASLLASMGGDEASAEEEPVAVSEPEPEPIAEAPAIDTSDPNKMMSPDDIAALLASMEQ